MSNGLISITIGNNGRISQMTPTNGSNVIGSNGVYFDYTSDKNRALNPSKVDIVQQTADYAEVVYSNMDNHPHLQQGFIIRRGVCGVYVYMVVSGTNASSAVKMREMRVCTRLASSFINGYVDDHMQGRIPSNSEMKTAEREENKVADATYRMADGSIYTKYDWGQYIVKDSLHGLMSDDTGVWNIACSHEWVNGGPMKQELTVHATSKSPITIQMLQGEHLGASSHSFKEGEHKIYGPFLIYVNRGNHEEMIANAKAMAHQQQAEWPFQWFQHELYPTERATVTGRINVKTNQGREGIQVILAEPGSDPYSQGKRYMFWTKTDNNGYFSIPAVRPDDYTLYAYATQGDITDQLVVDHVQVEAGICDLGTIEWAPKQYEHLLWMIGENNRLSDGYALSNASRSYLLPETVPSNLTFVIGESSQSTDWYYAQTKKGTWTVKFNCTKSYTGNAHLTASLAAVTSNPTVKICLNGHSLTTWSWNTNDGAIYRSATQSGRHYVKALVFDASLLSQGENTLTFNLTNGTGRNGVMWDCIKLETGDMTTSDIGQNSIASPKVIAIEYYNLQGIRMCQAPKGLCIVSTITEDGRRENKIVNYK